MNDICYTKGPSIVGHLNSCGVAARMLSQVWDRVEIRRVATHNRAENDLFIDSKLYEKLSMIVEISMKLTFATRNMNLLLSAIQDR